MTLTGKDLEYAKICCELCKDDSKCPYFFLTPGGKCLCECHNLLVNETGWMAIKDSETVKPAVKQSWEKDHDTICMEPTHNILCKKERKW